jgi:hypothetical protein
VISSAAAGSAVAAFGVFAVMATTLRDGMGRRDVATTASVQEAAAPSAAATSAPGAAPTALQDLGARTGPVAARSAAGAGSDEKSLPAHAPPPVGAEAAAAQAGPGAAVDQASTPAVDPAPSAGSSPATPSAPAVSAPTPPDSAAGAPRRTETASTPGRRRRHPPPSRPARRPAPSDPDQSAARPPDAGHTDAPGSEEGGHPHIVPLPNLTGGGLDH